MAESEQAKASNAGRAHVDVVAEEAAAAATARGSAPTSQPEPAGDGLDDKTKDELLVEAEARGVEVKTSGTKAEILDALRAAG